MKRRLWWKFLDKLEAATSAAKIRIRSSRPAKWVARQRGLQTIYRKSAGALAWLRMRLFSPIGRVVGRTWKAVTRFEPWLWVGAWLACAALGAAAYMPLMITKIIAGGLVGLVFLVLALRSPLTGLLIWIAVSPLLNLFIHFQAAGMPMITADRMCIMVLLIAYLVSRPKEEGTEPAWALHFCMFAFVGIMLLATLHSEKRTWAAQTVLDSYFVPLLAYFFARRWVTTKKSLSLVLTCIVITGTYFAILGIPEHFLHHTIFRQAMSVEKELGTVRIQGPAESPTEYGLVVLMAFLVVYAKALTGAMRPMARVMHFALLGLFTIAIALTLRRSIYVAMAVGMIVMIAGTGNVRSWTLRILTTLGFVGAGLWHWFSQTPVYKLRIGDPSPILARIISQVNSWQIIKHNPFGIGVGNFSKYYWRYPIYGVHTAIGMGRGVESAHNQLLTTFVEGGIFAVLFLIAIMFFTALLVVRTLKRTKGTGLMGRDGVVICLAITAGYFVQLIQGDAFTFGRYMTACWMLVVGAFVGVHMRKQQSHALAPTEAEAGEPVRLAEVS